MTSTTTDGNVEAPNTSKSDKTAKFKEAKTTSSGCIDFCFIFSVVTIGTVGCTIVTILLFGLPISMIIIGGIHKDHCKGSPHLAIWLIQYGVMLLARQCAFLVSKDKTYKEQRNTGVYSTLDLLIGWWPLIGGILTFGIDQSETIDEESPTYCHYTLYKFSFFLVIFAIIGLVSTALGKIYDLCKNYASEKKAKETTNVEAGETEEMKA